MSKTKTAKMDGPRVDDTESDAPEIGSVKNMHIWDRVCITNPGDTKEVTFGRKFTAIDAYSQIRQATEIFGPMGIGWGYDVTIAVENETVCSKLGLWYMEPGTGKRSEPIYVYGGATPDRDKQGNIKPKGWEDTAKKSVTDALTKALSYLGFNADVFLGKFDDNKYVSEQRKAHRDPPQGGTYAGDAPLKQDRMVPPEQPRDEPPQSSTGEERTDKQRGMMYAIGIKLWGKDGVEQGVKELCEANGLNYKALTKRDASTIIKELQALNGEETGDDRRKQDDDVPF